MFKYKRFHFAVFNAVLFCAFAVFSINAQSSDQNFPTPVTNNTLSGTIKARDIGDSRLTTYYFTFNGNQGDIFMNVVTTNLNGDIDVFAVEGLRPLTKIVVYADSSDSETGRVIYLRKPEKIIMRIQGRTPNDDPATFQIKFAGSFLASTETEPNDEPKLPEVTKSGDRDVIVNSVGTIIGTKPKPTPEPKPVAEKSKKSEEKNKTEVVAEKPEEKETEKPEVVVTENIEKPEEAKPAETIAKTEKPKTKTLKINNEKPKATPKPKKEKVKKTEENAKTEPAPNPLEKIRLVVLLKDGDTIEKPMSEVVKFGVEKGVLTIINKDGTISRYSILDVAKVTIE